jgi:hypothetical protein
MLAPALPVTQLAPALPVRLMAVVALVLIVVSHSSGEPSAST